VGYGDFHPETTAGKVLAMFFIVGGISILLGLLDAIAGQRIGIVKRRGGFLRRRRGHMPDSEDDADASSGPPTAEKG
jgi:hypothetical protein